MKEFRDTKTGGSNTVNNIEFNAEILTSGHWPFQDPPVCTIPPQMQSIQVKFNQFYNDKFSNRKLMWVFNNGNLTMQTTYLKKSYVLVVNVFQAAVLNLFNDNNELTVA
jgi:hypothetical protein